MESPQMFMQASDFKCTATISEGPDTQFKKKKSGSRKIKKEIL